MPVLTKVVKIPNSDSDFFTVIRGTKILHGNFLVTEGDTVKWGSYRFGKPHGILCRATPKNGTVIVTDFKKGVPSPNEVVTTDENNNGSPFGYVEMHNNRDGYDHIRSFKAAKVNDITIQKILTTEVNETGAGNIATSKTVSLRYEPTIGGSIYPVVVSSYKDIEVGKVYTRWFRQSNTGRMRMMAMARSSAVECDTDSLGYKLTIDEIIIPPNSEKIFERFPNANPTFEEKFETFKASKFGTEEYEKIKARMDSIWLAIVNNNDTYSGTVKESNDEEITINFRRELVDLALYDLQRGSGFQLTQIRDLVLASKPSTGTGEVPESGSEDVQCTGGEAPSVPDGNQDGVDSPNEDKTEAPAGS